MSEMYDARGARIVTAGAGRSGGEGTVSPIAGRYDLVAKVFHQHRVTPELEAKLRAMTSAPPRDPAWDARRHRSIAWPQDLLWHDAARTRFAGFTMPALAADMREAHTYYDPGDRLARFGGGFTYRHLMTAAANLASSVAAIHACGHRVGDMRETNLMVSPSALISLIDCDSFQVHDATSGTTFHTRVGTADYLPPELQGADFADDHDRTAADRFALGVLLFRFLMQGVHPYQAVGRSLDDAPTTADKIARGAFPYARRRTGGITPPGFAPPFEVVPPGLRELFTRCFVAGHRKPRARPSAADWFAALKAEAASLKQCRTNPNHVHASHLRSCPWCAMAKAGADPFPAPGAALGGQTAVPAAVVRRAVPPPAPPSSVSAPSAPAPARRSSVVGSALRFGRSLGPRRTLKVARALGPRGILKVARGLAGGRSRRMSGRRVAIAAGMTAVLVLMVSPVGRSAEPPETDAVRWRARAAGTCPTSPGDAQPCRATWRFGTVERTVQRSRNLFVLRSEAVTVTVPFEVRFDGDASCTVPWIDHLSFERSLPPVCFGACPERIELRSRASRGPLVAVDGVAARDGPLPCGRSLAGAWTFDATGIDGSVALHYPGLEPLRLPSA